MRYVLILGENSVFSGAFNWWSLSVGSRRLSGNQAIDGSAEAGEGSRRTSICEQPVTNLGSGLGGVTI